MKKGGIIDVPQRDNLKISNNSLSPDGLMLQVRSTIHIYELSVRWWR